MSSKFGNTTGSSGGAATEANLRRLRAQIGLDKVAVEPVDIAAMVVTDHAALLNLDFASSGHTGFLSAADLASYAQGEIGSGGSGNLAMWADLGILKDSRFSDSGSVLVLMGYGGGAVEIAFEAHAPGVAGGNVSIYAGDGGAGGSAALGGTLSLIAGAGIGLAGHGGNAILAAGASHTQNGNGGNGGDVGIEAGNGGSGGNGGHVYIRAGAAGSGGLPGQVHIENGVAASSFFDFAEGAAPDAPDTGKSRLYARDNGGGIVSLYFKKDNGVEVNLAAGGGSFDDTASYVLTGLWAFDPATLTTPAIVIKENSGRNTETKHMQGWQRNGAASSTISPYKVTVGPEGYLTLYREETGVWDAAMYPDVKAGTFVALPASSGNETDLYWAGGHTLVQITDGYTGNLKLKMDADYAWTGTTFSAVNAFFTSKNILTGTGAPEGAITAPAGSFYSRTNSPTVPYYKATGAGNTGWTPIVLDDDARLGPEVDDTAYDATTWNGVTTIAPSQNAVRDKLEAMMDSGGWFNAAGNFVMDGGKRIFASWGLDEAVYPNTGHTFAWRYDGSLDGSQRFGASFMCAFYPTNAASFDGYGFRGEATFNPQGASTSMYSGVGASFLANFSGSDNGRSIAGGLVGGEFWAGVTQTGTGASVGSLAGGRFILNLSGQNTALTDVAIMEIGAYGSLGSGTTVTNHFFAKIPQSIWGGTINNGLFFEATGTGYKAIAIRDQNVWIGSNAAGQLDLNGTTVKVNGSTLSGSNTGDQTLPVKATGTEINTGTDDEKFATAKAIADSNVAFTSDIPSMATIAAAMYPVGSIYTSVVSTNPNTLFGMGTWAAFGSGRVLVGIDAGDADFDAVEETGGAKTVASSAQTFAGTALATHQHAAITAGTPAGTISGIVVDSHASHTHTYTEVPNHVHVQHTNSATTGSTGTGVGAAADTSTSGDTTCWFSTSNPTGGVVTGTTAGPSATLTHNVSNNGTFSGTALATHQHAAITAGTPSGTNTAGAATSVVQPYVVVYMWKRTA